MSGKPIRLRRHPWLLLVAVTTTLCLGHLPAGAQALWSDGFESGRPCGWSMVVAPEICDGRDNDCDRQIDDGRSLVLKNTVIADNSKTFIWEDTSCNQPHAGQGANYQWPDQNAGGQPEQPCAGNAVFADPLPGELGDNGGLTETILLDAGSPAVGTATDCPANDQRGEPRSMTSCTPGATEP